MTHGVKKCRVHGTTYGRCRCIGPHEDVLVDCRPQVCGPKVLEQAAASQASAESPADLLRRAADRLDTLDRAASPGDWVGYSGISAENPPPRGEIFCGPRDSTGYRTGTVCSWSEDDENSGVMSQADIDLVCTLRQVAAPLATWLRHEAVKFDNSQASSPAAVYREALAVARAVLGETEG